jgi:hypothetical protein
MRNGRRRLLRGATKRGIDPKTGAANDGQEVNSGGENQSKTEEGRNRAREAEGRGEIESDQAGGNDQEPAEHEAIIPRLGLKSKPTVGRDEVTAGVKPAYKQRVDP